MNNKEMLKNVKVLCIEDDPITNAKIVKHLKSKVGKVISAKSGEEGIKKYIEYNPDIIVTDLIMEGIGGIDMVRRIRALGGKCPVAIASGLSDSKTILETINLKIDKYLVKPIDMDELTQFLEDATKDILEKKGVTIVNGEVVLTDEARQELELNIRNVIAKYLKEIMGKGAKSIQVFLKKQEIEIIIKGNLTVLEQTLLKIGKHEKIIEILRKTIYDNTKEQLEVMIENIIKRSVSIKEISMNVSEDREKIIILIN